VKRQDIARQMSHDSSTREKKIAMIWTTANSGEHHPLDGFTSMVCVRTHGCVCWSNICLFSKAEI